ncbi:hypothetical protein C1631_001790 [Chryseobacterium phosphatilyticum]|uniref:Uncharacterized protein n=1 Tax=Chryseobacterium phosphatilyticum TaxID=475075 RepID=A0A316XKH3_9FLAO|nr:hypothetical protein [Chryseobacterium phosphatilyticum]PWN71380.1 hypothetical protein C1631_001790 [Chryseobacterium phosphatilyticum]
MSDKKIQQYLLANHLKPLIIFRFDDEGASECFGVFVGSKKSRSAGDQDFNDLVLQNRDGQSFRLLKWYNETPLWILPLIETKEGYDLNYNENIDFPSVVKSGFISIVAHKKQDGDPDWKKYSDLAINTKVNFSHYLNIKTKGFSTHNFSEYKIIDEKLSNESIKVWFTEADKIATTDRLIIFKGIECEIVNKKGKKLDFDIWLGIRNKEDDKEKQNKIFLSINSENRNDSIQEAGTDCPIVWKKGGLRDDSIFPDLRTDTFSLNNNKLALDHYSSNENDLSYNLSLIDYKEAYLDVGNHYSWFIKEGGEGGSGQYLYPFFKYMTSINDSILKGFVLSSYNLIYFFQINRYQQQNFSNTVISWLTGAVKYELLNETFKKVAFSRSIADRAMQESLTPEIKNFEFSNLNQIILEHAVTNKNVSFTAIRRLNNPVKLVKSIEGLDSSISKNHDIYLPNFKQSTTDRKQSILTEDHKKLSISNVNFIADDILRTNDNGTFFAFSIEKKIAGTQLSGFVNDGSFSFDLDSNESIQGRMYFSLQLQKAQKPLYLWEWYKDLEKKDTIVPCYSIEDFILPVKNIRPLSTDLSEQERYIADDDNSSLASTGTIRSIPPLIIPVSDFKSDQKYFLSLSENTNVGQDFNFSAELQCTHNKPSRNPEQGSLEVVVLGHQPQTAMKIKTPFGSVPQYDNGKWVVARKNNLSADGSIWEILNNTENEEIIVTLPPQVMGEAFRKTDKDGKYYNNVIAGEPVDDQKVQFKFSPPAELHISNEQLNRQMVTAPWNIQHLFGTYGDSNPGLRLLKAQFELLYGMSAEFENKEAFIAELENKLGQLVKAPRGRIVWESNKDQTYAFNKAYSVFIQTLLLFNSRLAIYEVSAQDKFQPVKFTKGINYFFRTDYIEDPSIVEEVERKKLAKRKGAKLKWPFIDKNGNQVVPDYLKEIHEKYHSDNGLAGGFHFGFESLAIYNELWTTGYKKGSSSGEIENIAFSSLGGYGKQVARFANDKSIIKSTTTLGRTHFYAVERIGRVGVLWNKAKHVIEYERTVVPSEQFSHTENTGRVIMRKVREFVEILEPERKYPEFGADPADSGSVLGSHFKSIKIPVSSTWGRDIVRDNKPVGWEVPLWKKDIDFTIYPFPQIMLAALPSRESQLKEVLYNLANPDDLYFYTDVTETTTAITDSWKSEVNVDYTLQPFENIYLGASPCLDYNDPKLINTQIPSPLDVLPGFERFTFKILPSDIPISANGAYNNDSNVVGKLRTVTMQRKPAAKVDQNGKPIDGYITAEQIGHRTKFHTFLKENVNGYTKGIIAALKSPDLKIEREKGKVTQQIRKDIIAHFSSISNGIRVDSFKDLTANINAKPELRYLNWPPNDYNIDSFNTARRGDWEIPTAALWFQLTKELDAGIGAIDKNYTVLFKEAKKEFDQLIQENPLSDLKETILQRIEAFEANITDLKSHLEINLNQFNGVLSSEADKIRLFLEHNYSKIDEELAGHINKAQSSIDEITDPGITLDKFRTDIRDKILTNIQSFIKKLIENININKNIKDQINNEITTIINKKLKEISDYLFTLKPADFKLEEAKNEIKKSLRDSSTELKSVLSDLKKELADKLVTTSELFSDGIKDITKGFGELLEAEYIKILKMIQVFKDKINKPEASLKESVNQFFEVNAENKFVMVQEILNNLIPEIQKFLIKDYQLKANLPVPPVAHLFNKLNDWIKEQINDLKSFLNKLKESRDLAELEKKIDEHYGYLKNIYTELNDLEEAIKKGDTNTIIKNANELSQAINKDFGEVIGEVTKGYYQAVDLRNSYADLDKEIQNTLFNYRSVFEDIKAVDLGFNRKTIELVCNFKENMAPRLLLTPVMGKLKKMNEGLDAMGISIPYAGLEDKFVAPLKEWGTHFANSLSQQFPISNLLNDIGGMKFDHLFPFLKSDDAFFKAVKITHDLDKEAMKAWVKADVDYTFTGDNTFMTIGPVKVTMLKNARILAQANESIDIDKNRQSENTGSLKATFEISLSGTPLMLFKETVISFRNGKYDFDLDPARMEMPGLLKLLTDASKKIETTAPAKGEKSSPFKLEILKVKQQIGGKDFELPIGARASLDLPPLSIGGGPTSISNLSFGGNFIMKAVDDSDQKNLKLDFLVGLGFYLGKKELPFNFTAFILGGGGYIDCNFRYKPSENNSIQVDFVMSVHASAAFAISAGWISGGIIILAGVELQYKSGASGSTRIEIFIAIIGTVDILGLVSVYLSLRLAINYLSDGNGTVLYGTGTVRLKIKICAFVTIRVNRSYTMILKGESKSVSNSRSEEIATSLN